ncbi:MAG: HD domain-containing protein, partial [Clostridiales bacterium]|nr:HD domain-containing protein [Clostridiales bacterium]
KPGKLTPEERKHIETHPSTGAGITEHVKFDPEITDMVRHHHEHFDGSGYPDGLKGEAISFNARILAVADTLDAMLSDRPYRKGMEQERALKLIEEGAGTQFDPKIVKALLRAMGRESKAS